MSHPLLNKLKKFIKRLTDGLKKVDEALKLAEELQERKEVNRIDHYEPYPYQTEFHKAQDLFGTRAKQRLLMAANKVGKTFSGAAELAIHLTGKYPDWWTGHKFYKPIRAWAAGNTSGNTRDIVQAELLGEPGDPEDYGKVHCLKIRLFRQTEHLESQMLLVQSWLNIFLGRTRNCF